MKTLPRTSHPLFSLIFSNSVRFSIFKTPFFVFHNSQFFFSSFQLFTGVAPPMNDSVYLPPFLSFCYLPFRDAPPSDLNDEGMQSTPSGDLAAGATLFISISFLPPLSLILPFPPCFIFFFPSGDIVHSCSFPSFTPSCSWRLCAVTPDSDRVIDLLVFPPRLPTRRAFFLLLDPFTDWLQIQWEGFALVARPSSPRWV